MRLTLRTMLAHMDGILEPEDDEDIRKKIADSEFATNLMHRIRDVVRRLRLGAPGSAGRTPALDPNTVADYLDNALPDDQVADFEKACLESDVQLAELAAAHQILTLVLGEPVEIEPAARQRMYQLPQLAVGAKEVAEVRRREKPSVPDYLREPPRRRWKLRAGAILAVAACAILAALAVTGGLDPWLERAGLRPAAPEVAGVPHAPDDRAPAVERELEDRAPREEIARPEPATEPGVEPAEPPAEVSPPAEPAPVEPPADVAPVEPPPLDFSPPDDAPEPAPLPDDTAEPAPLPDDAPEPAPLPDDAAEPAPLPPPIPEVPGVAEHDAGPEALPGETAIATPRPPAPMPEGTIPGVLDPAAPAPRPEQPPRAEHPEGPPVGRLVSDRQLLLQFDSSAGEWDRVAMQMGVKPDAPVLALPTYRPVVALSAGATVQLVGAAEAKLHPADDEGLAGVEVAYGRLTMHTLGQAGLQIRMIFGERSGTMTFAEAESGLALEVYRLVRPGDDPESGTAPLLANLWTRRGRVVWQADGGRPVEVGAGEHISLGSAVSGPLEPRLAPPPDWAAEDQSSFLDRRASVVLADEIRLDRPAALTLHEVAAAHRQREVRWLAIRCLGHLGYFDPMVAVLDQEDAKTVWFEYLDELRAALSRDRRLAAAVRHSLQKQYGADAEPLYRMLRGYSEDDLRNDAAAELVEALEHDRLAVRLLSFWNLREITGLGLFYRPEYPAARRQQPVQRWRERLASGEIVRKAEQQRAIE